LQAQNVTVKIYAHAVYTHVAQEIFNGAIKVALRYGNYRSKLVHFDTHKKICLKKP
jgi:hypothetical protein